jgi:hypothetical protein
VATAVGPRKAGIREYFQMTKVLKACWAELAGCSQPQAQLYLLSSRLFRCPVWSVYLPPPTRYPIQLAASI